MKDLRVAVVDSFWDAYDELPKAQRKKTREFISKFRQSPDSNAINYEKLNQACQDNYRSVRIDQTYRAIVMVPIKGNVYVLLWVDHHDDCIQWSARTKCSVHPSTGTLQIYESVVVDEPTDKNEPVYDPGHAKTKEKLPVGLPDPIFNLDRSRLLGIGCPDAMVARVTDLRSKSELESIKRELPIETFDALMLFHEGMEWGEIWEEYHVQPAEPIDTDDVDAALVRDASRRRFKVVESELELQEMINSPLEKWRVYLHPSQRRLVERDWNGPVRVLGGAGTGKTVVAMHRAAWLARNRNDCPTPSKQKILFLTFNTNLAEDIKQNLAKLLTADELGQLEVINIDSWVARYLKKNRYTSRIVNDSEMRSVWDNILGAVKPSGLDVPDSFYTEEWIRVILPNRVESRQEYFSVSRQGRGVALTRKQRAAIWPVFDEIRSEMQSKSWRTYQDATLDAVQLLQYSGSPLNYSSVIVDETQDMGSEALKLIRQLAKEGLNDLFLVGDGHQRIYRKRAVMSHCGINIKGRGKKLKINYRTTEEIRNFAVALLQGMPIDDLDEGEDNSRQYVSLTSGADPEFQGFDSDVEEAKWIADTARELSKSEIELSDCCVMLRTNRARDHYGQLLRDNGLEVTELGARANNPKVAGLRIATLHRIKGLEFRHVFLASMCEQDIPNKMAITGSKDPTELKDNEFSERALVHVATTRAIQSLLISWNGVHSHYLDDFLKEITD